MAALTLFIFSLLVSTTIAIEDFQNTDKEERPAFQALPLQLNADLKQFYFRVFLHQIFDGDKKNTITVTSPNSAFPNFGDISIMDAPIWGYLNQTNLIARAQGVSIQSDQSTYGWHMSFNIEFEMKDLKGSTLMVMGRVPELTTNAREFAIVGGTGLFTLATGQVYGRRLSSPDTSTWIELQIVGYYTPMEKPKW